MPSRDFVIVGAGIMGLTLARTLARRGCGTVAVLEKEPALGLHASGRNSGVLHTGIYYGTDSLKARVCASGARLMREYASEHHIPLLKTGKVIVAANPEQATQIAALCERGLANGARVETISEDQLHRIEPEARTCGKALYSPDTAVIDARAVLDSLEKEVTAAGAAIIKSSGVVGVDATGQTVRTRADSWRYGHLINAAGLHADEVAHRMGVGMQYRILPFKGLYRKFSAGSAAKIRGSIYPVPDPRMPFLGVHLTRTVHGDVIAGPTAIPAFGREQYGILDGLDIKDVPVIAGNLLRMILRNKDGMRALVREEATKYWGSGFLKRVRALAPALKQEDFVPGTAKVGLRAQLVDRRSLRLVMDFIVEDGPRSTHILNAISPAFTASLALAELLADRIATTAGKA